MEKIRAIFDNKLTWLTLGSVAGSVWGSEAANAANAVGALVMAVL